MSQQITMFSSYKQKENNITNATGVILNALYRENPDEFENVLAAILESNDIAIGPVFTQQKKTGQSVPDLQISQKSLLVNFETKIGAAFDDTQLINHMQSMTGCDKKVLIALSNFEMEEYRQDPKFASVYTTAKTLHISFVPLSFEDLVQSLKECDTSQQFTSLLEEFIQFLDRESLLPRWKYMLDVVNCSTTMHEIDQGIYSCPATGVAYSHRRAKFFGPYSNKKVERIFEIRAVVNISIGMVETSVQWKNTQENDQDLIEDAIIFINNSTHRTNEIKHTPLQVFLLDNGEQTSFVKDSRGGLQSSKTYFWDIAEINYTSKDLANKLLNKKWSEFK